MISRDVIRYSIVALALLVGGAVAGAVLASRERMQTIIPVPVSCISGDYPKSHIPDVFAGPSIGNSDPVTNRPCLINGACVSQAPVRLNAFDTLGADRQLALVTELEKDYRLSHEIISYLILKVQDKSLNEVTRNNIANCLLNQSKRCDELGTIFSRMIDDKTESYKWRDYSVQHLGVSAYLGDNREAAIDKLTYIAKSATGGMRGTALRQLNHIYTDVEGENALGPWFTDLLISIASDEHEELSCRMSAISLLGERRERQGLGVVRVITCDSDPSLRRTAIAALGILGGSEDIGLITRGLSDSDPMVVLAAKAASKRLATPLP